MNIKQGDLIKIKESEYLSTYPILVVDAKKLGLQVNFDEKINPYNKIEKKKFDENVLTDINMVLGFRLNDYYEDLYCISTNTSKLIVISYSIGVNRDKVIKKIQDNTGSSKLKLKLLYNIDIDKFVELKYKDTANLDVLESLYLKEYQDIVDKSKDEIYYIGDKVEYAYTEETYLILNIKYIKTTLNGVSIYEFYLRDNYGDILRIQADVSELKLIKRGTRDIFNSTVIIKKSKEDKFKKGQL